MFATKLKLLEQYKSSEPVKQYFEFIQSYLQSKYFEPFYKLSDDNEWQLGYATKNLSIANAYTNYLYFYAKARYGLDPLYQVTDVARYDTGLTYDSGQTYDTEYVTSPVTFDVFKKYITFIYTRKYDVVNTITLSKRIAEFIDVDFTEIEINYSYDSYGKKEISILIPDGFYSDILISLISFYKYRFNLPFGYTTTIALKSTEDTDSNTDDDASTDNSDTNIDTSDNTDDSTSSTQSNEENTTDTTDTT